MEDLITKKTGNSRFLKSIANFKDVYPTYDAMAEALIAGTFPVDFNGLNPAGIIQMGTPFAKSQMLTAATAALFGMGDTAVPNDVFAWLGAWGSASWKLLAEYATAGAYTSIVPDDIDELGVFILGGGGGGGASSKIAGTTATATGGASGGLKQIVLKKSAGDFTPGESIPVVVGKGAAGAALTSSGDKSPTTGGTSSFGGHVTGTGQLSDIAATNITAQAPFGLDDYYTYAVTANQGTSPVRGSGYSYKGRNIFDPNDTHVYCGAGGFAYDFTPSSSSVAGATENFQQTTQRTKGKAGAGAFRTGENATAPGDGGGAAASCTSYSAGSATGGKGADGLVLVYGRKVV